MAFNDHVAVGQHIHHPHRYLRGDGFGIVNRTTAVELSIRAVISCAGNAPFLVSKPVAPDCKAGSATAASTEAFFEVVVLLLRVAPLFSWMSIVTISPTPAPFYRRTCCRDKS